MAFKTTIIIERAKKEDVIRRLRKMADELEKHRFPKKYGVDLKIMNIRHDLLCWSENRVDYMCRICGKHFDSEEAHYHRIDRKKVRIN